MPAIRAQAATVRLTLNRLSGRPLLEMSRPVVFGPFQLEPVAVQFDEVWEQRDVAVGVEFADRDTQPVRLVHGDDGVVGELTELGDAQPGSGE